MYDTGSRYIYGIRITSSILQSFAQWNCTQHSSDYHSNKGHNVIRSLHCNYYAAFDTIFLKSSTLYFKVLNLNALLWVGVSAIINRYAYTSIYLHIPERWVYVFINVYP